tara:strand:- start:26368 stop:27312 length:945 start_codon:yes stop_codon:yes gene_type:complete
MKVIFAGTPQLAQQQLAALCETEHEIVAVYTQPDRRQGRGLQLTPSPVKELALKHNIPVEQPASLRNQDAVAKLKSYQADIMLVVAYGLLLPPEVLSAPRLGCINMHLSLLPQWRGAAPIQYSLLRGDKKTGITLMQMDAGLDTGDILYQAEYQPQSTDTSESLLNTLGIMGQDIIKNHLSQIMKHPQPKPQDNHLSTHAPKIQKQDACLSFDESNLDLDRKIRAYYPWPIAFFKQQEDNIRILKAKPIPHSHTQKPGTILNASAEGVLIACGENALLLQELQFPGKKRAHVKDILNAKRDMFLVGNCLGNLTS